MLKLQCKVPRARQSLVLATETTKTTNSSGLVTFTFQVSRPIPLKRSYIENPCPGTENEADKHGMEPHRRKLY